MFIKTKDGRRINSDYVVRLEEIERLEDGQVRCLFVMDGGEEVEVSVSLGDLNRLDNGA